MSVESPEVDPRHDERRLIFNFLLLHSPYLYILLFFLMTMYSIPRTKTRINLHIFFAPINHSFLLRRFESPDLAHGSELLRILNNTVCRVQGRTCKVTGCKVEGRKKNKE